MVEGPVARQLLVTGHNSPFLLKQADLTQLAISHQHNHQSFNSHFLFSLNLTVKKS